MLAALFLLASSATGFGTEMLTEILAGKVLCSNPDLVTKTCSSIASFSIAQNGVVTETTELLISPNQRSTLEMSSTVVIDGATNCGAITLAEMKKGRLRINGMPLPPDRNEIALSKILEKLGPMAGRKTCDVLRVEAGQLLKYGQVDRIDIKLPPKPVVWISLDKRFIVAPHPIAAAPTP